MVRKCCWCARRQSESSNTNVQSTHIGPIQQEPNDGLFCTTAPVHPRQNRDVEIPLNLVLKLEELWRQSELRHCLRMGQSVLCLEWHMIKEHLCSNVHLRLGSKDRDDIRSRFLVGEADHRVRLALNVVNEDALLAEQCSVVSPRDRDRLDDKVLVLGHHHLHYSLLELLERGVVLGWRACHDVVLVVLVPAQLSELLGIRKLDVDAVLLHDALNVLAADADDPLVVDLGHMERHLGRQLFLQQAQAIQRACVIAGSVDEEVVVVEGLELDSDGEVRSAEIRLSTKSLHLLDTSRFHDLVELAILLARDKVTMLVSKLDLKADLVVERLDDLELKHKLDGRPDFRLETVKLEAI